MLQFLIGWKLIVWECMQSPVRELKAQVAYKSIQTYFVLLTWRWEHCWTECPVLLKRVISNTGTGAHAQTQEEVFSGEDEKGSAGLHNHLPARNGNKKQSQVWRCSVSQPKGRADTITHWIHTKPYLMLTETSSCTWRQKKPLWS